MARSKTKIAATLSALALTWPLAAAAEPAANGPEVIKVGPACQAPDEFSMPRLPVQIIIDEDRLARLQQNEYVVLRNDGTPYGAPPFVNMAEAVPRPPLR
jgi:hypothetical protein